MIADLATQARAIEQRLGTFGARWAAAALPVLDRAADVLERKLIRNLSRPGDTNPRTHRAAPAGGPPASLSGRLRASRGRTRTASAIILFAAARYAAHVEFGTKRTRLAIRPGPSRRRRFETARQFVERTSATGRGVAARPYFRPALRDSLNEMRAEVLAGMTKAVPEAAAGFA